MIKSIQGKPISQWREWLTKEINSPCDNVKNNPEVLQVLRAFKEVLNKSMILKDLEEYIK